MWLEDKRVSEDGKHLIRRLFMREERLCFQMIGGPQVA